MNRWRRCVGTLCVVAMNASGLVAENAAGTLTVEQAVVEARVRSPRLRIRQAQIEEAEGRLQTARAYPFNPDLRVEGARRSTPASNETDHSVALAQEIEIGGQRRARSLQANFELDAAKADLRREEQLLAARVRAAFIEALRAREHLEVEEASYALVGTLGEAAQKQFDAGSVAQIEVNLARVQVGRAARDLELARAGYRIALSDLAEAIGMDPTVPPQPVGELVPPTGELPELAKLVAAAEGQRPDLEALRLTLEAARARRVVAGREAVPNLVVEGFHGREEGTDRITGAAVGIRLPLFNRNQGKIVEARGVEHQTTAQIELVQLEVQRELAGSLARFHATVAAASSLQRDVLGGFEDNLRLLQRSFEAGKISWTEVLIFRREFVDVQRVYIETLSEAQLAAIAMDLALGAPIVAVEEHQP